MEVSTIVSFSFLSSSLASAAYVQGNRISTSGTSEYRLNGKVVTHKKYDEQLQRFNILVKAKNFLVFQVRLRLVPALVSSADLSYLVVQGDVEQVASQSPKDLAKLIDQISG